MSWSAPDARPSRPSQPYGTVLPAPPSRWRRDALTGFFVAAVSVLLGAPAGLLWSTLAPHARVDISREGASFADGVSEVFVAADGWFLGVAVVVGIASGVLAWLFARAAGPVTVVALAVGGLLAALVAAEVGQRLGQDVLLQAAAGGVSGRYVANVAVQAEQVLLGWPIAALATFLALVISRVDEIR